FLYAPPAYRDVHSSPTRRSSDLQTWIVVSLVIAAVSLFCVWGPYETLMPLVVTVQLHGSGLALALVFAAGGLGSVIVGIVMAQRSEEHTSELQSRGHLVCRLLLE